MAIEPLIRSTWWTVRGRAAAALVFVAGHAAVLIYGFRRSASEAAYATGTLDRAALEAIAAMPYGEYLRQTWAGGDLAAALALVGVLLAVGGVPAEPRSGALDLMLSLPVPRWRWLLVRGAVASLLLVLLGFVSAAVVALGGGTAGELPTDLLATAPLLAGLGALSGVALGLLATALTRDTVLAALLALVTLYLLGGSESASDWAPGVWLDIRRWGSLPWTSVASWALLVLGATGLAVRRFNRINS